MRADGSVTLRQGKWTLTQRLPEPLRSGRIRDVIEQRLQRISAKEREILEVASCEGDNFGSDTLVACLNIDRITVLKRLQSLEKNHALIRAEKDRYRFDHILIRQIVQESMLFELRQEYHRLIAASLMQRTGDNPEFAARIAYHLNASGQDVAALKYLLMAADQSRVLCAHEDAMRHYLKARETLEQHPHPKSPVRLLVAEGLGDVYTSLGRSQDALREYSLLLGLAREENRRAEEVRALRKSASNLRLLGDAPRAISSGEEALKRALSLGDTDERIKCLNVLALIHSSRGEYGLTIKLSQQALELSKTGNDIRNQSVCLSTVGFAHWHTGEYALAVQELENALVLQRQTGDTHETASTLNNIGLAYYSIGRYEDALNSQFESLRIKRSFGERPVIPGSLNNIGDTYRDIGDLAKAVRYHKESLALARELQNRGAECDSVRDLGADYLILGDLSSSRSFLEEVLTLSRTYGYVWYETRSCISLAELCLLEDKIEEADSWSSSGQRLASDLHAKLLTIESLWTRSGVLARMASVGQALPVLRQAIAIAEPCGHRPFLWQMYLDMARLYRGGGDPDEAGRVAEKARQIAQNILDEFRDENLKKVFRESAKVAEALNPARDARP
jgi:tetratricopeptide (TPR) repeat protein